MMNDLPGNKYSFITNLRSKSYPFTEHMNLQDLFGFCERFICKEDGTLPTTASLDILIVQLN